MSHYPHEVSSEINKSIASILNSYTNNDGKSKNKKEHNAIDILRIIKNESILLYEKQMILDSFDLDPHGIGWKDDDLDEEDDDTQMLHQKVQNILNELTVTSCRRIQNNENITIEAFIEIKKCDWMHDVKNNIQFKFLYQRFHTLEKDSKKRKLKKSKQTTNKTDKIRYSIDVSKDHKKLSNILTLQISSNHSYPYLETTEDDEYDCNIHEEIILSAMNWLGFSHDRLYTFILILMTFPYYEHEWNLMDCLMDDDDDGEMISDGDSSE